MISRLVFLLFCGNISLNLGNAQKLPRVKRQSLKVQINATGDAVCLRYIRPSPSIKLEGFILGYGSSFFSNQYIPLPSDGKPYITEVDAEPRYLIAVRPAPVPNYRKSCSGQTKTPKPLQLVIGTLTPTSVFLSWGVLINPKHDWITMNNCANDRFYTVRYREKDKNKKWILQLCPTTETVVDNLKPNIIYEFGVKDNTDNGIWSKTLTHNTVGSYKIKENGYLQNNNKLPKIQTQLISVDPKAGSPVTMIKEVIKNITHRTQAKTTEKSPLAGPILVHLIVPDFNQAKQKQLSPFPEDMSERSKKILAENNTLQWPAESKTSEIQELSPQSQPDTTELDWESSRPTVSSVSGEPKSFLAHTESELESSKPRISSMAELPLDTLAPHKFPEFPKIHTPTLQTPRGKLASHEMQPVPSQPQTTAPKTTQTKLAVTNEPILESLTPKTAKLDWPRATLVPSETPLTPFKWKPSATPEGLLVKPASKPPPLEQNIPKTSRITERLKTTPALPETKFVPSTTKPAQHKIPETKPAEKEPQWESTTPKIYKNPELPRTTQALSKTKITVSKPQILPHLEEPKTVPVTTKLVPVPVTTKVSHITAYPVTTMASSEPASIPSQSKETDYTMPEVPDNKPALDETDLFSSKPSTVPELPLTKSVLESITFNNELPIIDPKVKHHLFSTKTTISPHILQTKPVLQTTTFRPQPPMTEREEEDQEPSKPKILFSPDVSQTKPDLETITFRPEKPKTTTAPKETRRVPARAKTSASPGITSTKPGSKGSRRVVSRAKTSPSPNVTQTKPASAVEYFFPNKSKPSPRPRILETKPALYQTTSQPLTIKPTLSSGHLKTTMAPKETKFIPSKPKTSGKPEISQTKPAPVETIPGSINLHIHVLNDPKDTSVPSKLPSRETTESPHVRTAFHKVYLTTAKPKTTDKSQTRSVIHKTTPAPGRTRTAGRAIWGDILTEQDITRLFSTSASASTNVSADSTVARKKSDSVATPPDPPRPPLAPAKPTPMRRKPLPPNTVTGKPGSSGNILMPRAPPLATASSVAKPMRPTVLVRTGSPKKPPTASASPDYSNTTVFSLQPTSETDIAGKPRYKGDHVRYMKKEGDVPCSITDTLQHFPKEEGDNKNALSPPNNPPTNLTVVTVEGCASFVVLDWEKPENDTVTEYKVVSTENGAPDGKDKSVITTNLTHSTVENLKPNTSYEFLVIPSNPLGEGPSSETKAFKTESADPRVNEQISMGKDAIWTEIKFNSDDYSECKGKQYVKRTWYKKFVGVQLCNSLRYKIYLSDSLAGKFYNIGDQRGHGEDHCQFVDSYFDGKTGQQLQPNQLATKDGFFRAFRQEPVKFGKIGAATHTNYVHWYECGTTIPGKW
ncbi:target of Nesh-SH3 isoform X3 [Sphaerodactylus townsendi]|uniref:target of Nesh-SH3 isoform X3 n=1 Tax=Sphaerodactylus townsendi TaxID=933632 RepID=UPI002026B327|nr:target of Nesh-SH3 isoform X3 [Sphaerodactylus townsendi]